MDQFIQHPKHGRILSHIGWLNNNRNTHCSYCGNTVVVPGFCEDHYADFLNYRAKLDEIIKYRNEHKEPLTTINK